jgi:hypothetical protein
MVTSRSNVWDVWHQLTNFANNTESVDSNGEESLSEDNADDESDAENGSDIEVPVVSDDEVDANDLTVAEDDDQIEDADTVIWSEVEQNLNVEEFREPTGPQVMLPMDAKEIDYFKDFFSNQLIQKLEDETNTLAHVQQRNKPDPMWKDTTLEEMSAYLG